MMQTLVVTVLIVATASMGAPDKSSRVVDGTNPSLILEVAKKHGSAELTTDKDGDPMINGRISGIGYSAIFYLCEDGAGCKDVMLWAGWEGYDVALADVNRWNRDMRFGTAYIDDDGDPCLHMSVNLNHGVTQNNLDDTFDWWASMLNTYVEDVLRESGDASKEAASDGEE